MLGLVLSPGFLQMFVFWELVGLCSYLLIGYWYDRPSAAQAAVKAFWITKLGDLGFVAGIVMLWSGTGTFDFWPLFQAAEGGALHVDGLTTIMFLIYLGAVGKSAQFPLHVWLPDAMEGPTPVSALIHAATMVTAGVYMVARSRTIFEQSGVALEVVAWVGVATALYAATVGVIQTDIKRVLAYSTISQLGYMFAAFLTTFYTFRRLILAFFTGPRMTKDVARHVHESPAVMTAPLVVLAGLTLVTGWVVGIRASAGATPFARFLEPVFPLHEGHH